MTEIDVDGLGGKFAVAALTEIFKEAVTAVRKISGRLTAEAVKHDILGLSVRRYSDNLADRFNRVKIFGMNEPKILELVYTKVKVYDRIEKAQHISSDALAKAFEQDGRSFKRSGTVYPAQEIISKLDRIAVLGKPGAGKTTFLKYLLLQSLAGKLEEARVPIFVSLNDLTSDKISLLSLMETQFSVCELSDTADFLTTLLSKGRGLVLLDGLDEVSEAQRQRAITEIRDLSDRFKSSKFVVTCRTAAYDYCFETFTDVEVADFAKTEIEYFIDHWFDKDKGKAADCRRGIETDRNMYELAAVPLLLTMLCLAFEETGELSTSRADLYRSAIDALLRKWDLSRNIRRDEPYKQLTTRRKEDLFNFLAATTFEKDVYFIKTPELLRLMSRFLQSVPRAPDDDIMDMARGTLDAIEAHHGLIIERAKDVHSFAHLTFQEYFTASYIMLAGRDSQSSLARNYLTNPKWSEVIVLVANLLPEADFFMLDLLERSSTVGFPQKYFKGLRTSLAYQQKYEPGAPATGSSTSSRDVIKLVHESPIPDLEDVRLLTQRLRDHLTLDATLREAGTRVLLPLLRPEVLTLIETNEPKGLDWALRTLSQSDWAQLRSLIVRERADRDLSEHADGELRGDDQTTHSDPGKDSDGAVGSVDKDTLSIDDDIKAFRIFANDFRGFCRRIGLEALQALVDVLPWDLSSALLTAVMELGPRGFQRITPPLTKYDNQFVYAHSFASLLNSLAGKEIELPGDQLDANFVLARLESEIEEINLHSRSFEKFQVVIVAEVLLQVLLSPVRLNPEIRNAALRTIAEAPGFNSPYFPDPNPPAGAGAIGSVRRTA